jgi:Cu-Zn family superoxide dismutase
VIVLCGSSGPFVEASRAATAEAKLGRSAQAQLRPIGTSGVNGVITLQEVGDFVRIQGVVRQLSPGKHGFHVHEGTSCDERGGHFAPGQRTHGSPDAQERHVGDLGNLTADHEGEVSYLRVDQLIQLAGPQTIVGHVIVVHRGEDDYISQPSGGSGDEIACGKIELTS